MFDFLDDPNSIEYKIAVKVTRIILAAFAAICLFVALFFGGKNIASREAYIKAEVQVRSELLQQHSTTIDLQKWYANQKKGE